MNIDRYRACMLLHGVGDAMGYKNGKWEFNFSGGEIHKQLKDKGGVEKLDLKNWLVSDDTVLHLAIADCLIKNKDLSPSPKLYLDLVSYYKTGMRDMQNRAPGNTTINCVHQLKSTREDGFKIDFNKSGGGCGASMRSPCIGLRYSKVDQKDDLIKFSVESGRMTHHHPIGYLGSVAAALFTSYAIQNIEISNWGSLALVDFKLAKEYVKESGHYSQENIADWESFTEPWKNYLENRKENSNKIDEYNVEDRDKYYKKISPYRNWAGALGLDSVLIAYDGLLSAKNNWVKLCERAMLHGGDNDSTGCLAGAWYGALYGFDGVPEINYQHLEYKDRLLKCGEDLYKIQYAT